MAWTILEKGGPFPLSLSLNTKDKGQGISQPSLLPGSKGFR